MPMLWKPTGTLNVGTEATDLPQDASNGVTMSGALTRARNVTLEALGAASTRPGSSIKTTAPLGEQPTFLLAVGGVRFEFGSTAITRNAVSIAAGLTTGDWSAVSYNSLASTDTEIFACNASERKRITLAGDVNEWGIEPPAAAPSVGTGASTGLTGTYSARITYLRKDGDTVLSESNPSTASADQVLSNQSLSVSWTASSDPQVTHVRVYRNLAGGLEYFFDQDVAVGATSVDTSTADTALGTLVETDHTRPPSGIDIINGPFYNGRLFGAVGHFLYWSDSKRPEYWPADNFIEVGVPEFPIVCLSEFGGQVYCWTTKGLWYIQGAGTGFNPIPLRVMTGAPNRFGAIGVEGHGLFHVGIDGIYLYSGGRDRKISQDAFDPLWDRAVNDMQQVFNDNTRWLWQYRNVLYFHWRNGSVLRFNLDQQRAVYHKYDVRLRAPTTDWTNEWFLVGDNNREVRRLEDPDATDDGGETIMWELQSKDFTIQTRRHFPRWVKYDFDGDTGTAEVLLDDVVHQTHALAGDRNTRRRLITTGNGRRCSIRLKGSGQSNFYLADME